MSRFRVIPAQTTTLTREEMYKLIRSPVITEKSTAASEHNQVTFRVPLSATKREVKAAVEGLFSVKFTFPAVSQHCLHDCSRSAEFLEQGRRVGLDYFAGSADHWTSDHKIAGFIPDPFPPFLCHFRDR